MKFEYSGTVGLAQASGEGVSLTLTINGETITITIVGAQMTVITGKIVDNNGQQVVNNPGNVTPVNSPTTPTTPAYSLDGVWEQNGGQITVSGSTGVWSRLPSLTPGSLGADAISKGYYSVGSQVWRNLTSTGNLTWSGQIKIMQYNTSNPNVATGTVWADYTFTMSADGQTVTVRDVKGGSGDWTRKQ